MKLTTLNINSAWHNRKTFIQHYIDEHKPDILALQETRKANVQILGYDTYQQKPTDNTTRGVALLVRSTLKHTALDLTQYTTPGTELIGTTVLLKNNRKFHIIGAYIHRDLIDTAKLVQITQLGAHTIILGDTNAQLESDLENTVSTNHNGRKLQERIDAGELAAIVPESHTRINPIIGGHNSCIDYAITDPLRTDIITNVELGDDLSSDHLPVLFTTRTHAVTDKTTTTSGKPNIDKADWAVYQEHIRTKLEAHRPGIEPNQQSIDQAIDFITKTIQEADQETIPRKKIPAPLSEPLPKYIIEMIKDRRKILKIARRPDTTDDVRRTAKTTANEIQRKIAQEIKEFRRQKMDKKWADTVDKSPHGFWKLASTLIGTKEKPKASCPLKDANGKGILDDGVKAETFREYYETVFCPAPTHPEHTDTHNQASTLVTRLRRKHQNIQDRQSEHDFSTTVTPDDILLVLRKTKHTAPGADHIYYTHIKNLPITALQYLAKIYETCLKCNYFPTIWKQGQTILLPKPGKDLGSPKSYRPITLLSALGKAFERIINTRLKEFLELHNLFPETQAGFRAGRSTQDQLLKLAQEVTRGFQQSKSTLATFFDIEKAFDKLWIEGLILKLKEHTKLKEGTIALILNFLTDRTVSFKIGQHISDPLPLKAGTPQGSILSPTLFNLGVADIPQPTGNKTSLSQFADDIATWATHKHTFQAESHLQDHNDKISDWCKKWKITLAPAKTQLIHFRRKTAYCERTPTQTINGTVIHPSKTAKFLGITFDRKMSLVQHNKELTKRMRKRVRNLVRITGSHHYPRASPQLGLRILKSMIISLTNYAPTIQVLKTDTHNRDQDGTIRHGIRLALHLDKQISSQYVIDETNIEQTKPRTLRLARNYIGSNNRSRTLRNFVAKHRTNRTRPRGLRAHPTPLNIIDAAP